MSLSTFIYTKMFGVPAGEDELGNKYYTTKRFFRWFGKANRWVIYGKNNREFFKISPLWFKWLYYLSDEVPMRIVKRTINVLEKPTASLAYDSKYQSWRPDNNE